MAHRFPQEVIARAARQHAVTLTNACYATAQIGAPIEPDMKPRQSPPAYQANVTELHHIVVPRDIMEPARMVPLDAHVAQQKITPQAHRPQAQHSQKIVICRQAQLSATPPGPVNGQETVITAIRYYTKPEDGNFIIKHHRDGMALLIQTYRIHRLIRLWHQYSMRSMAAVDHLCPFAAQVDMVQ